MTLSLLLACARTAEPTEIPLDADPNGLWWDAPTATLYVADDHGNRILKWTDADGVSVVGELPAPADAGLGQVVLQGDRLYVTRFGKGTAGDIAWISVDGATKGVVSDLDPTRRRVGLSVLPDGRLVDAWFVAVDGVKSGGVSAVGANGGEIELVTGLEKPIGVLVVGERLFVSDQARGVVLSAPIGGGPTRPFATLAGPDLLAPGPDGSLFTGGKDGGAWLLGADGEAHRVAAGAPATRW
ncbi:MAG: hypothetical protein ABMB14_01960, partial [Myxococcota bacterium]